MRFKQFRDLHDKVNQLVQDHERTKTRVDGMVDLRTRIEALERGSEERQAPSTSLAACQLAGLRPKVKKLILGPNGYRWKAWGLRAPDKNAPPTGDRQPLRFNHLHTHNFRRVTFDY